jgi:hypothetical protein
MVSFFGEQAEPIEKLEIILEAKESANDQPDGPQRTRIEESEKQSACASLYFKLKEAAPHTTPERCTPETRGLHRGENHDSQETEFRAAQDRPRASIQRS